jgi:uncharacterized protein YyaL (SSP411 family)/cytochrome c biogenesis protein CcdA
VESVKSVKSITRAIRKSAWAVIASIALSVVSPDASESPAGRRPNHLQGETSPYLVQHLYNPVDWYPWGDRALARARELGRPIFLSIGYSACHWCHVMEREAFSDDRVAEILNRSFVPIKVDREERPDLDAIYMTAVQVLTGHGGWPMSVFLTPDLKPFFGGTYYPKEKFEELLLAIDSAWNGRREQILASAERVHEVIEAQQRIGPAPVGYEADGDLLGRMVERLEGAFDGRFGGFGGAPKFPPHGELAALLEATRLRGDEAALEMAVLTLDAMARGGLYDQVGGGFHRYSTDERWLVPHFEKMLYDNALLVPLYLEAWRLTGREDFRRVAEETLAWVDREMTDPEGGFYSSLDADSEGEEGRYYLWTREAVRETLPPEEAELVIDYFGLAGKGQFEGGGHVLHVPQPLDPFARDRGLEPEEVRESLDRAREKLLAKRATRTPPHRDDKVLSAWNGLMISAYARAYAATGRKEALRTAERAARFVLDHLRGEEGRLLVSWRRGRATLPAYLDDSAFVARGFLDLYEATSRRIWIEEAARIVRDADRFYDREAGGYYFTAEEHRDLIVRTKSLHDSALPSGNAIMLENLMTLSRASERGPWAERAAATLALSRSALGSDPRSMAYLTLAASRWRAAEERPGAEVPAVLAVHRQPGGRTIGDDAALAANRAPDAGAARVAGGSDRVVKGEIVGRANVQRVVSSKLTHTARAVRPGQAVTLSIEMDIEEGWHVNSSRPTLEYLIPTKVSFPGSDEGMVIDLAYPSGVMVELKFAGDRLSVYEGVTTIRATIRPPMDSPQGIAEFPSRLTYQACSDTKCLPPETREFKVALRIEGEPVAVAAARATQDAVSADRPGSSGGGVLRSGGSDLAAVLEESGLLTLMTLVFLGGLALNLTPCVYPMIPVTIGFFSGQSSGGWGRRVGLPTLYILGMAVTYSILGLAAGLTGGLFGATLQSPWVVGALVVLFGVMALSMFGLFEFRMPTSMTRFGGGRRGPVGAVLMGATVGLVAAPCIGPFVVGLLAFVGGSGQPVLGFWLFFVLAIGLGLPSLVLGISSGALANLPRSGMWLIYAKKVMGIALLAVAIYFLQPFLTDRQVGWIALAFAGASALYLAILERSRITSGWFLGTRLFIGALVAFAGLWLAMPLVSARPELEWGPYTAEGLEAARAEGRPVIIDFFADWCLPCKELDRYTFSDPHVIEAAERFTRLKADLTSFSSEPVAELRDRFAVVGVPTIVFIDGQGTERVDLRLYGFEEPEEFLERLAKVQ